MNGVAGPPATPFCMRGIYASRGLMVDAAYHAFDFWIGRWEVRDPGGVLIGRDQITRLFDGCALREEWRGVSGLRGTSLNVYVASRGIWHQTWIDSAGNLLQLEGGFREGAMVLEGVTADADAPERTVRHRISWSILERRP